LHFVLITKCWWRSGSDDDHDCDNGDKDEGGENAAELDTEDISTLGVHASVEEDAMEDEIVELSIRGRDDNIILFIMMMNGSLVKAADLGRADGGEVRWMTKEDDPLALLPLVERVELSLGRDHGEVGDDVTESQATVG